LSETGHVEGRNVAIEFRWTGGREDRMAAAKAQVQLQALQRAKDAAR